MFAPPCNILYIWAIPSRPRCQDFSGDHALHQGTPRCPRVPYQKNKSTGSSLQQFQSTWPFLNLQLTDRQHHSRITNEILKTFDCSNEVVLVLLDLSAAFDTVDCTLLIERLRLYLNFFRHCSAMVHIIILMGPFSESNYSGAPNEKIVQNLNIALLNVFQYLNGRYRHIFIPQKFFICSDFLAESSYRDQNTPLRKNQPEKRPQKFQAAFLG